MTLHVFLDEAGSLGSSRDPYFVLLVFATTAPRATRKCFLKARHARLPRKYRHYAEVKFSDRAIPDRFQEYALQGARLEIRHVDSTTNVNIQVADFLTGAVYQKYARGNERYYTLIADRIEVERELFGA